MSKIKPIKLFIFIYMSDSIKYYSIISLKSHFFCFAAFFPFAFFMLYIVSIFSSTRQCRKTLTILMSIYMYCLWRFHNHKSRFIKARFFWGWWVIIFFFYQVTVSIQMIAHSKLINRLFSFGKSWKRLKVYEKRETSSHWSKRIFEKVKKSYTWRLKILKIIYCKMNSKSSKLSCFASKKILLL